MSRNDEDLPGAHRFHGDLLLSPGALVGLAVLIGNDQILKRVAPGIVSGKASDKESTVSTRPFSSIARNVTFFDLL